MTHMYIYIVYSYYEPRLNPKKVFVSVDCKFLKRKANWDRICKKIHTEKFSKRCAVF